MIRINLVKIYDIQRNLTAVLDKAVTAAYELKANELATASFTLPADDPKNSECQPFYFAEIFDGPFRVGLFRILDSELNTGDRGAVPTISYNCEDVLGKLLDITLFRDHQLDNLSTRQSIQYVLDQVSAKGIDDWRLGTVDFDFRFSYSWSNENALNAIFSIAKPFLDDYLWVADTTSYPWTLSLVAPETSPSIYARYGKNLRGLTRDSDPAPLATRLYALGYGEGVNQLGIESVNGGKEYIEDTTAIAQYGLIERTIVDKSFEKAKDLLAIAKSTFSELKKVRVSYTISMADLSREITTEFPEFGRLRLGTLAKVDDTEVSESFTARVIGISKQDVEGAPGDVQVTIANKPADVADEIASLTQRQLINDLYAQGATNMDTHDFADNCDPTHPAVLTFPIPQEVVNLNKAYINVDTEAFRGYSRATKGGGAISKSTAGGGGTTTTSSSGGGTTTTSSSGGGVAKSTASGGGTTQTTSGGGEHRHRMFFRQGADKSFPDSAWQLFYATRADGQASFAVWMPSGAGSGDDLYTYDAAGYHSHSVTIPAHTHSFSVPDHSHTVKIPDHTHTITLPDHTHSFTIPDHTHEIDYGIYEGPTPSKLTLKVDGTTVGTYGAFELDDFDIIPYLAKDSDGNVTRGRHKIEITPSDDIGRIVASITTMFFIQSRGGGTY